MRETVCGPDRPSPTLVTSTLTSMHPEGCHRCYPNPAAPGHLVGGSSQTVMQVGVGRGRQGLLPSCTWPF